MAVTSEGTSMHLSLLLVWRARGSGLVMERDEEVEDDEVPVGDSSG